MFIDRKIQKNSHIIVGLSGGVDSSVSALLLKNAGFKVEAVFMKNWEDEDDAQTGDCTSEQDLKDAKLVCDHLNIPLHVVNFSREYWDKVFTYFLDSYAAGLTPNPDILCNQEIKFKAFLEYAQNMGADFIATGHYARIKQNNNGEFCLLKGVDNNKDQTYFLHKLNQYQLSKAIFPLGELTKDKVREIAKENDIPTFNKKDSTGVCFIGERKFKSFLEKYLPAKPGKIITPEGDIIGKHDGLMYYTLGQRQGLNIGGLKNYSEKPWYVADKDLKNNKLVAVQDQSHPLLNHNELVTDELHWIQTKPGIEEFPYECQAKIRYRQQDQPCTIILRDNQISIKFKTLQKAITPGQSVVLYQDDLTLGGGVIQKHKD